MVSKHDPLGADLLDVVLDAREEAAQVVLSGLLDLAPVDVDVVEGDHVPGDQPLQVEPERLGIRRELAFRFLERQEHPRLAELRRAPEKELHPEHGLSAARRSAHQRRAAFREPASRDFIQPADSRERFRNGPGSLGERAWLRHLGVS
jgi:hypothetical protein